MQTDWIVQLNSYSSSETRSDGDPGYSGTGIVVSPNVVLTCHHVIENVEIENIVVISNAKEYVPTNSFSDPEADIALLLFEQLSVTQYPHFFAGRPQLKDTDEVLVAGFPRGYSTMHEHIFQLGAKSIVPDRRSGIDESLEFSIDDPGVEEGYSGGPVIVNRDSAQIVIGMMALGGRGRASSRSIGTDKIANHIIRQNLYPQHLGLWDEIEHTDVNGQSTVLAQRKQEALSGWLGLKNNKIVVEIDYKTKRIELPFAIIPRGIVARVSAPGDWHETRSSDIVIDQPFAIMCEPISNELLKLLSDEADDVKSRKMATGLSRLEATRFGDLLSLLSGLQLQLPTSDEWEFSCRGAAGIDRQSTAAFENQWGVCMPNSPFCEWVSDDWQCTSQMPNVGTCRGIDGRFKPDLEYIRKEADQSDPRSGFRLKMSLACMQRVLSEKRMHTQS